MSSVGSRPQSSERARAAAETARAAAAVIPVGSTGEAEATMPVERDGVEAAIPVGRAAAVAEFKGWERRPMAPVPASPPVPPFPRRSPFPHPPLLAPSLPFLAPILPLSPLPPSAPFPPSPYFERVAVSISTPASGACACPPARRSRVQTPRAKSSSLRNKCAAHAVKA